MHWESFRPVALPRLSRRGLAAFVVLLASILLGTRTVPGGAQVSVLTRSYNLSRTGANLNETTLNTSNVNASQFAKLFTRPVEGEIYAQPLYVPNLTIPGKGAHNVVFVATMKNWIYAFDADDPLASAPLWSANFGPPVPASDVQCCCPDISTWIGILGTPVIDPNTGTIYLVSRNKNADGTYHQWLHALNLTTGAEKLNGPVEIAATYNNIAFDPKIQNQRPGLALNNGVIYIAWASHNDCGPYHGWVMGYNASNLQQVAVYNVTPTGGLGGIWMAGQAPTIDDRGNLYVMTGNGTFDANSGGPNLGCSFIKLTSSLSVNDWFTPNNVDPLNAADADLGSSGCLGIPGTKLIVGGGKEGKLYLLDTTDPAAGGTKMGHFHAGDDSQTVQAFQATNGHIHGTPVFYNSPVNGGSLYVWSEYDNLKVFKFNGSTFQTSPIAYSTMQVPPGMPGAMMTISANGQAAGSAIVWASHPLSGNANNAVVEGIVRAFDANTIVTDGNGTPRLKELWNSKMNPARDDIGMFGKFAPPTVANGKVYLATFGPVTGPLGSGALVVYGLLPKPQAPPSLVATAGYESVGLTWTAAPYADSYTIRRATTSGGPYEVIATGLTTTAYLDFGLNNGTTYYYTVTGTNGRGDGPPSNEAHAKPGSIAPEAPLQLAADPGDRQIALTWSASLGAISYNVKRSKTNGGPYTAVASNVVTTGYTDKGLTNGTTYYYVVTAVNPAGEGVKSNQAFATPLTLSGGLLGSYYNDPNNGTYFNTLALQRIDPTVNFDWGGGSPAASVHVDDFSVRWSGVVTPKYSETYTFYTTTDDGVRLWVNGQQIIDKWQLQGPTEWSGTITLAAGVPASIRMEFYEHGGGAVAKLAWSSASQAKEIIPQDRLSPAVRLSGNVSLLGSVNLVQPLTFRFLPADGTAGFTRRQTLDRFGNFFFDDVPPKDYTLAIKGTKWLSRGIGADASHGSLAGLMAVLLPGDVNNDDVVDLDDLVLFFNAYGSVAGDANWNANADLTCDGQVELSDLVLFFDSYGLEGDFYSPLEINYPEGFAGTNDITLNGSARLADSRIRVTDGGGTEAGSAFYSSQVTVSTFQTRFQFQITNPNADGMAFVLQKDGLNALGPTGGGLGYGPDQPGGRGGIPTSIAVKFDLYNNAGEGVNSTGLYLNGASPSTPAINLDGTGIDLHSGHVFQVDMTYDGTTLTVLITDTLSAASATQTYTVNIPGTLGGNAGYAGFTGGTGGLTAVQDILNWTYGP